MSEAKKKLFGLFRRKSTIERESNHDRENTRHHRNRPSTSHSHRHRPDRSHHSILYPHEQTELKSRSRPSSKDRSSVRQTSTSNLPRWPPPGFSKEEELSQGKAMEFIATGAPVFKGHKRAIIHASDEYYALYATCDGNGNVGTDRMDSHLGAFALSSFRLHGSDFPWETLEQPSMEFCYGNIPGAVTLNHWVSLSARPNPAIELRDPGVRPREIEFSAILERLRYLESGFEEDYPTLLYKNLYSNLLKDPDRYLAPHTAMEKQIADLIVVLSRPEWIDFSKAENQVVAKYFTNVSYTDRGRYKTFFHQLLLSRELEARIYSREHKEWAKERVVEQLPPCIKWDLALARRWRDCITIENFKTEGEADKIRFHLKVKKAQVKALRKFARKMKWPNLMTLEATLQEKDPSAKPIEDGSSDTMSYFTGMILPGPTFPWLLMNTVIDCDPDAADLTALTHMHPNSGFQYKSTTYWSATSIIGKVLAPTCHAMAGWIGPARPAPDLRRVQIARLRQRRPKLILSRADVKSMTIRSDPLGPPSDSYPVSDYVLLDPDEEDSINTIRIEKLALKPVVSSNDKIEDGKPVTYDAAVQFAIDGRSWPLRLSYDVSFIAAFPCSRGPHPLFFDYVFKAVAIDEILNIKDWGGGNTANDKSVSSLDASSSAAKSSVSKSEGVGEYGVEIDKEKVLVIEAFGVADNEVLARAWCSHWGLSAVVAEMGRSCMSCAIREAYAACLNVVILVQAAATNNE